jgi:hypothetical protein
MPREKVKVRADRIGQLTTAAIMTMTMMIRNESLFPPLVAPQTTATRKHIPRTNPTATQEHDVLH